MFHSRKKFYATIVLAIAVAALAAVYLTTGVTALTNQPDKPAGDQHQDEGPSVRLSPDEIRRAGIKIERVQPAQFADTLAAFGTIGANRNSFARVASPVAGRLVKVAVDLGGQVSSGETLAILESPELAEIRAAYLQGQTELDLTRTELDRAEKLAVDRSISQKDLLRARADHERARAALTALEGKLATLGVAATAPAGSPAAFLAVAAPFAGTVVERTAVLGEYAQAYQALFTVADLSTVWVETNLYDRDLADVAVGAPATVTVGAYRDQRFAGKVTYVGNMLDKDTRTAVARVEVANVDGRLKPGLFATVEIEKTRRQAALRVPENALVLLQGQMTAFVAHGDGFEPRPVEIGERSGGMVVVKSGLEAGDSVVVAGSYALKARLLKSQIGDAH
jgi:cobalt-zinc-cadmium efflux system membrane fusion protein